MRASSLSLRTVALAIACACFALPVHAGPKASAEKQELQRMYIDFLAQEGYRASTDDDGDVTFKKEGGNYFISVMEDDKQFFRIVFPNFWTIESEQERTKVKIAADAANGSSKVVKIFTVRDDTWAAVEIFVADPADFKKVFTRAMSALDYGVQNFVGRMKE